VASNSIKFENEFKPTWYSRIYAISRLSPDSTMFAETPYGVQAYRIGNTCGVQFHAEKNYTYKDVQISVPDSILNRSGQNDSLATTVVLRKKL
jgi:hypothetical protein